MRRLRYWFSRRYDVSHHFPQPSREEREAIQGWTHWYKFWEDYAVKLRADLLAGRDTIYEARGRLGVQPFLHPLMRAISDEEPGEPVMVTYERLGRSEHVRTR